MPNRTREVAGLKQRMRRSPIVLLLLTLALSGCSSISGRPEPITAADVKNPVCPSDQQMATFMGKTGRDRGLYRDWVIGVCADAYTNKFNKFTSELSGGSTVANLIGDTTSGTLTTVAGVASPKAAKRLSVIAASILGIQGAVNNDVYANKAVSALVAAMQIKRAEVMTEIINAEKADPNGDSYTLASALIDLRRYEEAGTLATGITELNKAASKAAAEAATGLADAQRSPTLDFSARTRDPASNKRLAAITTKIKTIPDTPAGRQKLDAIAKALSLRTNAADSTGTKIGYILTELSRETDIVSPADQPALMDSLENKLTPLL